MAAWDHQSGHYGMDDANSAPAPANGASIIHAIFHQYAVPGTSLHSATGVPAKALKQLLLDAGALDGVPSSLVDACVREHMLRADHDQDGSMGIQDFVVWLLAEVAALLPVRDAFDRHTGLRPLYNQYHAVLLGDVGFTDGARKPATGMLAWQLLQMASQYNLLAGGLAPEAVRQAMKAARQAMGGDRGSAAGGSGGGGAQPEAAGGSKLQFAQFVRALELLSEKLASGLDVVLYQVVSCGLPPPLGDPRVSAEPMPLFGLESDLEGELEREVYRCRSCGQRHARWRLADWRRMEEHLLSVRIPSPVQQFMPCFKLINARNMRAAFHRYNMHCCKGRLPPPSRPAGAGAGVGGGNDGGPEASVSLLDQHYGVCCCLFRPITVMDFQSWSRLCSDCEVIREALASEACGLTHGKLEQAFMTASTIAGVYCPDDSPGIHDLPLPHGSKLRLPRNKLGAVSVSDTNVPLLNPPPKRSSPAYMLNVAAPAGSPAGAGIGQRSPKGRSSPRASDIRGPASGAAWVTNSLIPGAGGPPGSAGAAPPAAAATHRPPRLGLTFPQFLEALRLVAEEMIGHPLSTPSAEAALMRIVHDIVRAGGCPRPDPTTSAGTATIRKLLALDEDAGVLSGLQEGPPEEQPPVPTTALEPLPRSPSATSATTSTKYDYDDFTPPESNLYTSASSSRIGGERSLQLRQLGVGAPQALAQRRAKQAAEAAAEADDTPLPPTARRPGAMSAATSADTSVKYSYGDFTPPESNLYTSASSSRIGRSSSLNAAGAVAAAAPSSQHAPQGSGASASTRSTKPLKQQAQQKDARAQSSELAAPASPSATSAGTSTKYSYGDFTPPESNLYTSASSSRIGSKAPSVAPAAAAADRHAASSHGGAASGSSHIAFGRAVPAPPSALAPGAGPPPPPTGDGSTTARSVTSTARSASPSAAAHRSAAQRAAASGSEAGAGTAAGAASGGARSIEPVVVSSHASAAASRRASAIASVSDGTTAGSHRHGSPRAAAGAGAVPFGSNLSASAGINSPAAAAAGVGAPGGSSRRASSGNVPFSAQPGHGGASYATGGGGLLSRAASGRSGSRRLSETGFVAPLRAPSPAHTGSFGGGSTAPSIVSGGGLSARSRRVKQVPVYPEQEAPTLGKLRHTSSGTRNTLLLMAEGSMASAVSGGGGSEGGGGRGNGLAHEARDGGSEEGYPQQPAARSLQQVRSMGSAASSVAGGYGGILASREASSVHLGAGGSGSGGQVQWGTLASSRDPSWAHLGGSGAGAGSMGPPMPHSPRAAASSGGGAGSQLNRRPSFSGSTASGRPPLPPGGQQQQSPWSEGGAPSQRGPPPVAMERAGSGGASGRGSDVKTLWQPAPEPLAHFTPGRESSHGGQDPYDELDELLTQGPRPGDLVDYAAATAAAGDVASRAGSGSSRRPGQAKGGDAAQQYFFK